MAAGGAVTVGFCCVVFIGMIPLFLFGFHPAGAGRVVLYCDTTPLFVLASKHTAAHREQGRPVWRSDRCTYMHFGTLGKSASRASRASLRVTGRLRAVSFIMVLFGSMGFSRTMREAPGVVAGLRLRRLRMPSARLPGRLRASQQRAFPFLSASCQALSDFRLRLFGSGLIMNIS